MIITTRSRDIKKYRKAIADFELVLRLSEACTAGLNIDRILEDQPLVGGALDRTIKRLETYSRCKPGTETEYEPGVAILDAAGKQPENYSWVENALNSLYALRKTNQTDRVQDGSWLYAHSDTIHEEVLLGAIKPREDVPWPGELFGHKHGSLAPRAGSVSLRTRLEELKLLPGGNGYPFEGGISPGLRTVRSDFFKPQPTED